MSINGDRQAPLVLVHGVGDTRQAWDMVVGELGDDLPIVTYDLRGHGAAETRPLVEDIDDFVDDLVGLLDEQGIDHVHVAGFSLGGLIAQRLSVREPDRIRTLTVVGAVAGRTPAERERVLERLREVELHGPGVMAEKSLPRWFTPEHLEAHPEAGTAVVERMSALDHAAYVAAYRVLATTDLVDQLAAITVPTLAIAGADDIGSPPHMAELIARCTGGRAVVFPGIRHNILEEAASQTAKEIRAHVNRTH